MVSYLSRIIGGKDSKIVKELSNINHPAFGDTLPSQTDFGNFTKEQLAERQSILQYSIYSHVKHIAMDTRSVYYIDNIDAPVYYEVFDLIAAVDPYFKSTTKSYGKNILIKSGNFIPTSKRHQFKCEGVELLYGTWSCAPMDGEMFNSDCPVAEILQLEHMLNIVKQEPPKLNNLYRIPLP